MIDLFRQYMLSSLTGAERDQLRERLIGDQALSDELRDRENNWIEAYAAGQLPAEDATRLHQYLAATGQLHRVATAAALARPKPAKPRSTFPYAFGIAAIVVLCFGAFLQSNRDRPQIIAQHRPLRTIVLTPGTLRDGRPIPKVPVTPGMDTELQLIYQDTAPAGACRVTIRSAAGEAFDDSETPCGQAFHPHIIGSPLSPGRYTAGLATANGEAIHTYFFDVTN